MKAYCPVEGKSPLEAEATTDLQGRFEVFFDASEAREFCVIVEQEGFVTPFECISAGNTSEAPMVIRLTRGRYIRFELVENPTPSLSAVRISWDKAQVASGYVDTFFSENGVYRVAIPEWITKIEMDVPTVDHPIVKKRLEWPRAGDLDLGRIVITETLGK